MKSIINILILFLFIILAGCKETGRIDFVNDSAPAPDMVTVTNVVNTPGGAVIKYNVPDDINLLGVKVTYTRNGVYCESKASKYVDSLVVQGFGNTDPQTVELYSVGVGGKLSAPIPVDINPLTPPVQAVKFDLQASFGGVKVVLENNVSKADLSVVLLADTLYTGELREMYTFYTKSEAINLSRRGFKNEKADFATYIRDRWNNVSDTIYRTLTPIEEIKIPKTNFRNMALPTDFYEPAEGLSALKLENMWDGIETPVDQPIYASTHSAPMPSWFTIDLGLTASISRIQKWPRAGYELYSSTAPRTFQVWGSMNPNPDGSWDDSWTLLGDFEQFKPSGYGEGREVGTVTDEDKDYWYNKTEFEFLPTDDIPDPYMHVTCLRFKILSNYNTYGTDSKIGQVIIGKLTFWGQVIE